MVTLQEQVAVEALGPDRFSSCLPPTRMGDLADWAYGGNILAIAIIAAYTTIKPGHHLSSLTGHFVRPASPLPQAHLPSRTHPGHADLPNSPSPCVPGKPHWRTAMPPRDGHFHVEETLKMVNYSARPHSAHVDAVPAAIARVPESGMYKYINQFMEVQPLLTTDRKSEGDITGIISAESFRLQTPLESESAQLAALAFYMDRGLAYIPANHAGRSLLDASACATLDFALRVLTHRVDVGEWMVSEQQTCAAWGARAVSEGRVFDGGGGQVGCCDDANDDFETEIGRQVEGLMGLGCLCEWRVRVRVLWFVRGVHGICV